MYFRSYEIAKLMLLFKCIQVVSSIASHLHAIIRTKLPTHYYYFLLPFKWVSGATRTEITHKQCGECQVQYATSAAAAAAAADMHAECTVGDYRKCN